MNKVIWQGHLEAGSKVNSGGTITSGMEAPRYRVVLASGCAFIETQGKNATNDTYWHSAGNLADWIKLEILAHAILHFNKEVNILKNGNL
jgi:hypothetical protein